MKPVLNRCKSLLSSAGISCHSVQLLFPKLRIFRSVTCPFPHQVKLSVSLIFDINFGPNYNWNLNVDLLNDYLNPLQAFSPTPFVSSLHWDTMSKQDSGFHIYISPSPRSSLKENHTHTSTDTVQRLEAQSVALKALALIHKQTRSWGECRARLQRNGLLRQRRESRNQFDCITRNYGNNDEKWLDDAKMWMMTPEWCGAINEWMNDLVVCGAGVLEARSWRSSLQQVVTTVCFMGRDISPMWAAHF